MRCQTLSVSTPRRVVKELDRIVEVLFRRLRQPRLQFPFVTADREEMNLWNKSEALPERSRGSKGTDIACEVKLKSSFGSGAGQRERQDQWILRRVYRTAPVRTG